MTGTSNSSGHVDPRLERERAQLERDAADKLSRLAGALELQAAILALLLPARSARAEQACAAESQGAPNAAALREHVSRLSGPARLPWFEALVSRMRHQPLDARETLLEATRRVMGADNRFRPIDRLRWLAMRQWLGESSSAKARTPAGGDLAQLPQHTVASIAMFSAFLSRLVPVDSAEAPARTGAPMQTPGELWYETVMEPWQGHADIPTCKPPDTDGLVHSLQELQALAWMQRPTLVRGWVVAAQHHSRHGQLGDDAADALRMCCSLLDSPMPPELARLYGPAVSPPGR